MNFIIGTIGLIIIIAISSYRNAVSAAREKKFQEEYLRDTIGMSEWLKTVTDQFDEDEIANQTSYTEVEDVIKSIPHQNELHQVLKEYHFREDDIINFLNRVYPGMVKRIQLGKQGKLPHDDAIFGIKSPGVWNRAEVNKWLVHRDIMIWLDKELRDHGISEPMRFIDGAHADIGEFRNGTITGVRVQDDNMKTIGGLYYWHPSKRPYLYIARR